MYLLSLSNADADDDISQHQPPGVTLHVVTKPACFGVTISHYSRNTRAQEKKKRGRKLALPSPCPVTVPVYIHVRVSAKPGRLPAISQAQQRMEPCRAGKTGGKRSMAEDKYWVGKQVSLDIQL